MKRKNLAKAFYDFAKLAFAGLVVAPIATHATKSTIILGSTSVVAILILAWVLDIDEGEEK